MDIAQYNLVALATGVILVEYFIFIGMVGAARVKYDVQAPSTSGDPAFERTLRVQENTLEQLIYVLPAMWLFAIYMSPFWAAILGFAFAFGRALYCAGYRSDPAKRAPGFLIGALASMVMLIGGIYGAVQSML